jgi:drug/metabolite transporter (DMT)-like permease
MIVVTIRKKRGIDILKSMNFSLGAKYIILSTIFFALMNVGVKYIRRIPAYEIVFFRALVSLAVAYALIKRKGLNPWGNNKPLLIYRGIAGTIALMMYFYTLQHMPLASAVTIQYLSPIFTILIAGVMLKEPARPVQWLFFAISFIGVMMIKGFDMRISVFGLVIGIAAAFFAGLAYNFIRKLKDYDHHLVVVFYFPLVTVPTIGLYTFAHWVIPGPVEWLILILIGLATTAAQIYMTKAYQIEKAANISNYNYLGTVYALILGYFLFGELISVPALIGIGLIIFGVISCTRCGRAS